MLHSARNWELGTRNYVVAAFELQTEGKKKHGSASYCVCCINQLTALIMSSDDLVL